MRIFVAALSVAVPPPPAAPPPPPAIIPPPPIGVDVVPAAASHRTRTRVSHTPVFVTVGLPEATFILGAPGVGSRVFTTCRLFKRRHDSQAETKGREEEEEGRDKYIGRGVRQGVCCSRSYRDNVEICPRIFEVSFTVHVIIDVLRRRGQPLKSCKIP